jgi:two-component system, LytTR family, sensor kinase
MSDTTENQSLDYQRAYRKARHQVKHLRAWYIHALIFSAVIGFLWLHFLFGDAFSSWHVHSRTPRMPLGVTLGWGFGVLVHGIVVWTGLSGFGQNWKESQIRRMMEKQGVTYRGPVEKPLDSRLDKG